MSVHWGGPGAGHVSRWSVATTGVPVLSLDFVTSNTLDSRITFSRTTNATLVDATGKLTYAPNNLVLRSEEFNDAEWSKTASTITPNATSAPNGTTTADKLVEDTATSGHFVAPAVSPSGSLGQSYVYSVYVKAAERTFLQIILTGIGPASGNLIAGFNLANGTVGTPSATVVSTITDAGNGWFRCSAAFPISTAGSFTAQLRVALNSTATPSSYTGDGVSGLFIWGAQLEAVTYQTAPSAYVQTVASAYYGPRFDYNPVTLAANGLLIEEQRTNSIRNNTMVGAAAGTPGTLPTNWSVSTAVTGLTRQIVGVGLDNGITYLEVRLSGTPSAAGDYQFFTDSIVQIVASSGQTWAASSYYKLQAGSLSGVSAFQISVVERDAVGNFLAGTFTNQTSPNATMQRGVTSRTLSNASTARVSSELRLTLTGAAIDITLRIGLPQLELGAFVTSVIPTATAQVTRAADIANITGTNFSSWYSQSEGTFVSAFQRAGSSNSGAVVSSNDNTSNNRIQIRAGSATAIDNFIVLAGSVNFFQQTIVSANAIIQSALGYKTNDVNSAVNGVVGTTDTSEVIPIGLTTMSIGNVTSGGFLNGYIRQITYYPSRLTNAQLQALTI